MPETKKRSSSSPVKSPGKSPKSPRSPASPKALAAPKSPRSPAAPKSPRSPKALAASASLAAPAASGAPRKSLGYNKKPFGAPGKSLGYHKKPFGAPLGNRSERPSQGNTQAYKNNKNNPYYTPWWPPSNYQVPAKLPVKSPTPGIATMMKYRAFIEELKTILTLERVIDRDNNPELFADLLVEQEKVMDIYHIKKYKMVCFIEFNYSTRDKTTPRVFHKGNKMFGNFNFRRLLEKHRMSVKQRDYNSVFIHK